MEYADELHQKRCMMQFVIHPYKEINFKNTKFLKDFNSTDIGFNFHSDISSFFRLNLYSYVLKEEYNSEYSMMNYLGDMFSDSKRNFQQFREKKIAV